MSSTNFWIQCAAKCLAEAKDQQSGDSVAEALLNDLAMKHSSPIFQVVSKLKPSLLDMGVMVQKGTQLYSPHIYPMLFSYNYDHIEKHILTNPANPRDLDFYDALRRYDEKAPRESGEGMNRHLCKVIIGFTEMYLRRLLYVDSAKAVELFPDIYLQDVVERMQDTDDCLEDFDDLVLTSAEALITKETKFSDLSTLLKTPLQVCINDYFVKCRDNVEEESKIGNIDIYDLGLDDLVILTSPYSRVWQLAPYTEEDYEKIDGHLHDAAHPILHEDVAFDTYCVEEYKRQLQAVREGKNDKLVIQECKFTAEEGTRLWVEVLHTIITTRTTKGIEARIHAHAEEMAINKADLELWFKKMDLDVNAYVLKVKTDILPVAKGAYPGVVDLITEYF